MRLLLSNGKFLYVDNTNARLLNTDDGVIIVGSSTLYGVTDDGTRYRLTPTSDGTTLDLSTLDRYVYQTSQWGGSWTWVDTSLTIKEIPSSLNADDTFNFDNFSPSLLLTFILAVIVILNAFKRR